jgi:proline dehydrogenase
MDDNAHPTRRRWFFIKFVVFAALLYLVYRHGETWARHLLLYLSRAPWARTLVTDLPVGRRVAMRFVAGGDREAAVAATRSLNQSGLMVTLDYLGESCTSAQEAAIARNEVLILLDCIADSRLDANVSVKLSQLGLKISEALAEDNLRQIARRAAEHDIFVRVDMEDTPTTDATLRIVRDLRYQEGLKNLGVVIQSYLYRSEADVAQLIDEGVRVRLCKGAYAEPADVAFPDKADTDANYVKLSRMLLSDKARAGGVYPAMATHDPRIIDDIKAYVQANRIPRDSFEFQMLYGIRRDLQDALVAEGYRVRVYVPYGTAWYPYFMRRLAERPANVWFFVSNFFRA